MTPRPAERLEPARRLVVGRCPQVAAGNRDEADGRGADGGQELAMAPP